MKDLFQTQLNLKVHDISLKMNKGSDKLDDVKGKFEELQLQLALGKADTEDAIKEQKAKIKKAIQDLEYTLKHNKVVNEYIPVLQQELEKFKIKSEILYEKHNIDGKKKDFLNSIDNFKEKYLKKVV